MAIDIQNKLVRKSLRLKSYDYSEPGAYFVTICTENRFCYLANIVDGITISYPICDVIREIWLEIPKKFHFVDVDAFIIMPNHVHGIVIISRECGNLIQQAQITVGKIVRYFKAKTTKIIHHEFLPSFQWQRNYYEHVVRTARELNSIREYIINNPIKWALDRENRLSKNFDVDLENYFKDIFEK